MARDNLPYLLTMVLIEYCIVSFICLYCKEKYATSKKISIISNNQFKSTHNCIWPNNLSMRVFLLLHRVFWLAFFSVCCAYIYIEFLLPDASNYQYFTFWNVFIIIIYYTLTTCASLIGLCLYGNEKENNTKYHRFGVIVNIFFEVVGSTAIWITVINFAFLDPTLSYLNIAPHLFTSISLLIEMTFSALVVDATNMIYLFTWILLYIIVIMILYPATGEIHDWPYWFLDTASSKNCYFWYSAMFAALTVAYSIWWLLSKIKCRYLLSPEEEEKEGDDLTQQLLLNDSQLESQPPLNEAEAKSESTTISLCQGFITSSSSFDNSWAEAMNAGGFGWWQNVTLSEYYSTNISVREPVKS